MPLFNRTDLEVSVLTSNIKSGSLGLPDLQRPFVWPDTKVRDLVKSMIKGYPIGFVILWTQPGVDKSRLIGTSGHAYSNPNELIIDGQQRLTSLYSLITGSPVKDNTFKDKRIVLSYNPSTEAVEVAGEAFKKSPDWIYDLTTVFMSDNLYDLSKAFVDRKVESLEKTGTVLSESEKGSMIGDLMSKLSVFKGKILNYQVPILTINKEAEEEDVADIFVNINSGGTSLNQSDFILTLVSVHYPEGRTMIEEFSKNTRIHNQDPKKDLCNPIFFFEPSDIIRVVMAYGFKRGRLKYAYKLLRGADFEKKGAISEELRNSRFDAFKLHLGNVLDANNFKEFLKCVNAAGFVKSNLLNSANNIVYAYAFWLIGKYDFGLDVNSLKKVISKAVYFFNLTSRYSGSFEGLAENELLELDELAKSGNKDSFSQYFENLERTILTNDYFNITLVERLKSSSNKNPEFLAYIAAQNILDAKVLFSRPQISTVTLYNDWISGTRNAVELHHLFPKQYLKNNGYKFKEINQVGNYAFIEWTDNMDISDDAPSIYFKREIAGMSEAEVKDMLRLHAIPFGWEDLDYQVFLSERRKLMAAVIREGYEKLS